MRKIAALLTSIAFVMTMSAIVVSADTTLPFEIEPQLPDKQEEGVSNYISIKSDGDYAKDTYLFKLTNNKSENIKVRADVVDAYTSPGGVVQYTDKKSDNSEITDESYKLSSYLKLDENIIDLKAKEEVMIEAKLDMSNSNVEGILLGGLRFQTHEDEVDEESNLDGVQIKNKINIVFGVKIENDYDGKVDVITEQPFVDPMPSYYSVRLPVEMKSPTFKSVKVEYEIMHESDRLFKGEKDLEFAPKTKVNVDLPWAHESIKENEGYTIVGKVKYNENDEEVVNDFEYDFTFKSDSILEDITSSIKSPSVENGGFIYIFASVMILFIIVVAVTLRRKGKQN